MRHNPDATAALNCAFLDPQFDADEAKPSNTVRFHTER